MWRQDVFEAALPCGNLGIWIVEKNSFDAFKAQSTALIELTAGDFRPLIGILENYRDDLIELVLDKISAERYNILSTNGIFLEGGGKLTKKKKKKKKKRSKKKKKSNKKNKKSKKQKKSNKQKKKKKN